MNGCKHSPAFSPGACRSGAIDVKEYYDNLMRRNRGSDPAVSANILIRHFQEYMSRSTDEDLERGVVDDMPLIPIVKYEDIIQGDQETITEESPIPSQRNDVQCDSPSTIRTALSVVRELPPTFV